MNAIASPYAMTTGAPARDARDVEYDAFSRATAALRTAQRTHRVPDITAAVHLNTVLWNALLAALSAPGNRLAETLRGDLASLALFSVRHGHKVAGPDDLAPLIDVNIAMMRGLRGEGAP